MNLNIDNYNHKHSNVYQRNKRLHWHLAAVFTLKTWYKSPGYTADVWSRRVTDSSLALVRDARQHPSAPPGGHRDDPPGQPRVQCQGDYVQHRCINHPFFSRWAPWPQFWRCWFWSLLVHTKPKGSPVDSVDFISDIMKHQSPYITSLMQFPHLFFISFVLPGRLERLVFLSLTYRPAHWSFSTSLSPLKPILIAALLRRFPQWNHTLKFLWWKTD